METYINNNLGPCGSAMSSAYVGLNLILMNVLTGGFMVTSLYPNAIKAYNMNPYAKGVAAIWAAQSLGSFCAYLFVDKVV